MKKKAILERTGFSIPSLIHIHLIDDLKGNVSGNIEDNYDYSDSLHRYFMLKKILWSMARISPIDRM